MIDRKVILDQLPEDVRMVVMSFYSECSKYTVLLITLSLIYFIFFMSSEYEASVSVFMIPVTLGIYFTQKKIRRKYIKDIGIDIALYKMHVHATYGLDGTLPKDMETIKDNYKKRYALSKAMGLISTSAINTFNRVTCWMMLGFYTSGVVLHLIEHYL